MGWSCTLEVSRVLERWSKACLASTNSQNEWSEGSRSFFFEVSRKEHLDGSATGQVYELRANGLAFPVAPFRIEPDGTVSKGRAFLKRAAGVGAVWAS